MTTDFNSHVQEMLVHGPSAKDKFDYTHVSVGMTKAENLMKDTANISPEELKKRIGRLDSDLATNEELVVQSDKQIDNMHGLTELEEITLENILSNRDTLDSELAELLTDKSLRKVRAAGELEVAVTEIETVLAVKAYLLGAKDSLTLANRYAKNYIKDRKNPTGIGGAVDKGADSFEKELGRKAKQKGKELVDKIF